MKASELYEYARNAASLHDYESAKRYSDELLKLLPEHSGALLMAGSIAMNRGRYGEAGEAFEKILTTDAENIEALNNLGVVLKQTGDIDEALHFLYRAYERDPGRRDICYNIANCLKQKGTYPEAIQYYRKAIQLDPDFALAYNNLGTLYQDTGEEDKAEEVFREGLERDANHPSLRYNLGRTLENKQDYDAAAEEYRRSLKGKPGWPEGLNNLGIALERSGRLEEAQQCFSDLLRRAPDNPKAHNNLAAVLLRLGESKEAEKHYRRAMDLDRHYTRAAVNLSAMKSRQEGDQEAIREIEELCRLYPGEQELKIRLAEAYISAGKVHKAGAMLAPLLRQDPRDGEIHLLMGRIRKQQKKFSQAEQHFHLALRYRPNDPEPLLHLALLYRSSKRLDEARDAISRYSKNASNSFEGSIILAELLLEQELFHDALELFEELESQNSGDKRVIRGLIEVHRALGNREEAALYASRMVQGSDDVAELEQQLDLYEEISGEYARERESIWRENLLALHEDAIHSETDEGNKVEEESIINEGLAEFGEEEVPIIDVGGIEPVIAVDEEEEELDLRELEEDLFLPEEKDEEEPEPVSPPTAAGDGAKGWGGGEALPPPATEQSPHLPEQPAPAPPLPTPAPSQAPGPSYHNVSIEPLRIRMASTAAETPKTKAKTAPEKREQNTGSEEAPPRKPEATGEESEENNESPAELLAYLEGLTQYLPESPRKEFESSDMPLRMEALRAKLEGRPGVLQRYGRDPGERAEEEAAKPLESNAVKSSFSFLEGLTEYLPGDEIRTALRAKIGRILESIDGDET